MADTQTHFRRFSLRTLLCGITSVSIFCVLFSQFQARATDGTLFAISLSAYFLGWVITAASVGFDISPTAKGIAWGVYVGILIAYVSSLPVQLAS